MHVVLIALVLAVAGVQPPLEDCEGCRPRKLCEAHDTALDEGLKTFKSEIKSKDAGQRARALERLAELNAAHANAPSKDVTSALEKALKDPSVQVKIEAAKLLGRDQEPGAAISALEKGLKEASKALGSPGESDAEFKASMTLVTTVIESMGGYRDDRTVKALVRFLPGHKATLHGKSLESIHAALIDYGTQGSLRAVLDYLAEIEGYAGFGKKIARMIHDKLTAAASDWEVDGIPTWSDDGVGQQWQRWLKKNARHFPRKLGKLELARA